VEGGKPDAPVLECRKQQETSVIDWGPGWGAVEGFVISITTSRFCSSNHSARQNKVPHNHLYFTCCLAQNRSNSSRSLGVQNAKMRIDGSESSCKEVIYTSSV
jgi:hypothetical protein